MGQDSKQRIIQEFVPGKQVTLAHIISKPDDDLYEKMGLVDCSGSIGIMTITPSEAAVIAGDVATKAGNVKLGFIDRFNGSVFITGNITAVEASMRNILSMLCDRMGFAGVEITRS